MVTPGIWLRAVGVAVALLTLTVGCTDRTRPAAQHAASSSAALAVDTQASPLSARIELPTGVLNGGSTTQAQVIVTNNTGAAIVATGCQSLFQVALSSGTYTPQIIWLACAQTLTLPEGLSTYSVTVMATWIGCVHDAPSGTSSSNGAFPLCVDGHPPALPTGDYVARLYQSTPVVPDPDPVSVQVVA